MTILFFVIPTPTPFSLHRSNKDKASALTNAR